MLPFGSLLGHKMASKICNMSLPRPKLNYIASQDGLPIPKMAPKMAPEALGMSFFAPTIALPQTDEQNFEGAAGIPERIVNKSAAVG